ncbi:MAG: hypothetical protein MI920_22050 [Kiloniellales bacterium]|nr:hypothetical protein [Kiloniellales bacterium]
MSWKETDPIERPSPCGGRHARLEPRDTVTWGPGKAEWRFTFYRLVLDGRRVEGDFTQDLVWEDRGRWLAAVLCLNAVAGDSFWNYAPADWKPQQALVVVDPQGPSAGRAAFDPACFYKPLKFESEAIVYEKTKHFAVGPVWEMEVAIDAITDWRPL